MPNTALITGASAGIGAEFARYHARKGGDLVIVARRQEPLDALKAELEAIHDITVTVIAMDAGTPEQATALFEEVKAKGIEIDVLINNAGFGGHGAFLDRDLAKDQAMIDLNVGALVTLSHHVGQEMKARGKGKMLQVSSTAAFQPGPYQATYFATKAFVNSFSQAIDHELRSKGVTCTVLAPGYVKTEFAEVANLGGTKLIQQGGATAKDVAKHGYDAMMQGKLVTINETRLSVLLNWVIPLMPRRLVLKIFGDMQEKQA